MRERDVLTVRRVGRPKWLPAGAGFGIGGLLVLAALAASLAQTPAPSGEELYVDRLGCWNCHGTAGRGGEAHSIAKTQLPLRRFIKHVRLPSGTMPPVPAVLASDGELATIYQWLDGLDAVKIPPPITVRLKSSSRVTAGSPTLVETEVEFTAVKPETTPDSGLGAASLHSRVTLVTQANAPVADLAVEYQLGGRGGWSTFTLDPQGEAVLGPDRGLAPASARETQKKATVLLRMPLTSGRYAVVVEVLDGAAAAGPVVVGIGTAILKVE